MTQENTVNWAELVATLLTSKGGRDRDVAEWRLAMSVIQNLHDYRPKGMPPVPAQLARLSVDALASHVENGDDTARAWSEFREAVTWLEAQNATRLLMLCTAAQTLSRMRDVLPDASVADGLMARLAEHVFREWGFDLSISGDLRAWCARKTVQLKLLPSAWRYL
jgi:hypothetical protein